MVKHFYSFIVETDTLFLEIDSLEISDPEKMHLKSLAESHIHNSIIDKILTELAEGDRKIFLTHLNTRNQQKIWKFINSKMQNAENKIIEAANAIKIELLKDIKEVKEKG